MMNNEQDMQWFCLSPRKYLLLTFEALSLLYCPRFIFAQDKKVVGDHQAKHIDSILRTYFFEEISLRTDRSYYTVGDTIWFSAWVLDDAGRLSDHSGVLYVELCEADGTPISRLRLPVMGGRAKGGFPISIDKASGYIRLRSYTQWMRNASHYCDQPVYVRDLSGPAADNHKAKPRLSAFTVGGDPVNGLFVHTVVQLTGTVPLSSDLHGWMEDEHGAKVARFTLDKNGFGHTYLQIADAGKYVAKLPFLEGSVLEARLPKTVQEGHSLEAYLLPSADTVLVRIQTLAKDYGPVYLALQGGDYREVVTLDIQQPLTRFKFSLKGISARNVWCRLFSGSGELINTFPVKHKPANDLDVQWKISPVSGKDQGMANFEVMCTHGGAPVKTFMRVAVKPKAFEKGWRTAEQDSLWSADETSWHSGDNVHFPAEELGSVVKGQVLSLKGQPSAGAKVLLLAPSVNLLLDTTCDNEGNFRFDHLVFAGRAMVTLQATDKAGGDKLQIIMDSIPYPPPGEPPYLLPDIPPILEDTAFFAARRLSIKKKLEQADTNGVLPEVEVVGNKPTAQHSHNLNGPGKANQVLLTKDLEVFSSLSIALEGRLTGAVFRTVSVPYGADAVDVRLPFSTRSAPLGVNRGEQQPMLTVLDGVPLSVERDGEDIADLYKMGSPDDIASVEVLRDPSLTATYGAEGRGGVIVIERRKPWERRMDKPIFNVKTVTVDGFSPVPEFDPHAANHDGTIYWNPDLITDAAGKINLSVAPVRNPENYVLEIEAIDLYGDRFYKIFDCREINMLN